MHSNLPRKLFRRARYWLTGENAMFRERRLVWRSVSAFEKLADSQCPQSSIVDF